jgi:hypothetical protein
MRQGRPPRRAHTGTSVIVRVGGELVATKLQRCYEVFMDRDAALAQIRKACNGISLELMKINPAVSALNDKEAEDEIYRTVFELTKEVETIKKRLAKLGRSDETRAL